ncbi:hypothetical protein LshimejAT787_0501140 [Lyophyllum shimeji]|uniref:Uncharacterized protein n=1 Tax=Lyophyllum shimeji TaxID=47721 RepID=A0A9P3PMP4_LYOSH|nr:hypothetical protein LshimejAT787_0501140 [Lyophyllum shimeji]
MSFCRPLLSSVHIPKLPRQPVATRYGYVFTVAATRIEIPTLSVRLSRGVQTRDRSSETTSPGALASPSHIPSKPVANTVVQEGLTESLGTTPEQQGLRTQDRGLVANSPPAAFLHVMAEALAQKNSKLAERVVLDILERYRGADAEQENMLQTILSQDISLLSPRVVLRVLEHLKSSSPAGLSFLTANSVGRLARMISDSPAIRDTDRPLLRIIYPLLLERLETFCGPEGMEAIDTAPHEIIYASFSVTHKLLSMSFVRHALHLFQALAKSNYIPVEALHRADSCDDVNVIVTAALVKASLHWNWRALAAGFLMNSLKSQLPLHKLIIDLNIDVIYALLDTPTHRDICACGHLIRRAHHHMAVPPSIIRQFYTSAAAVDAKDEAEYLYAFTRHPKRQTHHYPPPQGVALPWLMRHLATMSSQTHLARTLAKEVVADNLAVPVPFRARFVALTAAQSYGRLSRALWERYATAKDAAVVVGNSALMLRMVSLFWNIHLRTEAELSRLRERSGETAPRSHDEDLRARSADSAKFVEHVIQAFRDHHAPLAAAPHWVLTSLARACFIVGKIPDGFEVFQVLLGRKELPDMYDANVALSAVSQVDSQLANQMMERMMKLGVRLDVVTLGTALHHAVLRDEWEVVKVMIQHIRGLDDKDISLRTLAGLVHASISLLENESEAEMRTKLGNILHLIRSFPEANIASSLPTAKSLVYASLRAKDGVLAYRFWKLLLRRTAEWGDKEQQDLRHRIARLLQQPGSRRGARRTRIMLARLGQSG